jgi:glycerophosphoryl diester phosphodiesterase|tara:strand:- start:7405 stop:8646 length:1242 start_codon:yes stop_codon:yes gene_type:complete
MHKLFTIFNNLLFVTFLFSTCANAQNNIELGDRPLQLVAAMDASALKQKLSQCDLTTIGISALAIGHRGAPRQYPEHTREGYIAAATQGAGTVECDVTFTKDKQLVCRHSQCDLHSTTNILLTPLAKNCSIPFQPATFDSDGGITELATAQCCTSDITLDEFFTLKGKKDAFNSVASNVAEYQQNSKFGTVVSHQQSIELFKQLNVKMAPELKAAGVAMPYQGMSRQQLAEKMIEEYRAAGVDLANVYPQSFQWDDLTFWQQYAPKVAANIVALDGRYQSAFFNHRNSITWLPTMRQIKRRGINIIAPPLWMLLEAEDNTIVPSGYALAAKAAGLTIITWTLERSPNLDGGGGWYYQTLNGSNPSNSFTPLKLNDGKIMEVLDVLVNDIGVIGVFSDWPATVTFFDYCGRRTN